MFLRKTKQASSRRRRQGSEAEADNQPMGYSSRRITDNLNTGRNEARSLVKINNLWLTIPLRIVVLLLTMLVVYKLLALKPLAKVAIVSNNEAVNQNQYAADIDNIMSKSILDSNKITLNKSAIGNSLKTLYPSIETVYISSPVFSNTVKVTLVIAQPSLVVKDINGNYFDVDDLGRVIGQQLAANNNSIPIVTDESGLSVSVNKQLLPTSNITFIKQIIAQLAAKSFKVSGLTLPANAEELDVSLAGQPYIIKFNLENNDPRQQAGTFLAVIAQLSSQKVTPVKYVDVRLDGRAYYQ